MRGISEERLRKFQQSMFARENGRETELRLLTILIDECKELNTWITLEEFLKSGFDEIDCWVFTTKEWELAKFNGEDFCSHDDYPNQVYFIEHITRVQPIHKPEPPR